MNPLGRDPFALAAGEPRRIGDRTVDLLVGRVLGLGLANRRPTSTELYERIVRRRDRSVGRPFAERRLVR